MSIFGSGGSLVIYDTIGSEFDCGLLFTGCLVNVTERLFADGKRASALGVSTTAGKWLRLFLDFRITENPLQG